LLELDAIAAVVVGGTALTGGRGSVVGTLLGALFIGELGNGLNLAGVKPYLQKVIFGLVILGAVLLDRLRARRR
jgi:ribose/xylose/arabinose/galactoside ABC-type transport system permease subunit